MKNVLILTGRYLPNPSANGVCIKNIISAMPKDNYNVTCICYDDGEESISERETIIKVSKGFIQSKVYHLESNNVHTSLKRKCLSFLLKLKQIPFLFCWPWTDPVYTHRVFKLAKKLHIEKKFDAVVAVHMPLSSVIVGHKLKNEYPEIQFYPYFLDSLSGGRPIGIMSEQWNMKMKLKWEDRLLVNADKIIVMESSRAHHEKYNKNKCFYNKLFYLDIPLLSETHSDAIRRKKDDKINVIFCGTANYPMRNVKYFLDLVSRIKNDNIIFTFIGSSNYKPLTESKIKNVRYIPSVAHDMLTEYYLNADILFNLGVTTKSAISGKIFEYMSYGKPIISTYSIDDEACLPYLQKYQLSFLVDERSDITNEKAAELYNFIEENYNKRVDISYIKKIFYKNMPNTFVDEIFANR